MTSTRSKSAISPPPKPDSHIKAEDSLSYWNSISADVNGMLGGFPQISRIDLQGSKNFVAKLRRMNAKMQSQNTNTTTTISEDSTTNQQSASKKLKLAVDCGAGIGRITEGMLVHVADKVDIVEPVEKFARELEDSQAKKDGQIGDVYISGLESWQPGKKYDLIWNQWCVGHLNDTQLVDYLRRAGQALTRDGWMVVKENLSTDPFGEDIFDDLDSSVTRSDGKFRKLFELAGLDVLKGEVQTGFPKSLGLFPVKMYALRPI